MKKSGALVIALFFVLVTILAFVPTAKSDPIPAPSRPAPSMTLTGWGISPTPVKDRVIEVVDKISPATWKVGKAVNWLDTYTASDMRLVAGCSGKTFRCVTLRSGKVKGAAVGWSSGSTITIDTAKAMAKWKKFYKLDKHRTWLMIHELAHQHGLGHSSGANVMNERVDRYKLVFTSGQRAALRKK